MAYGCAEQCGTVLLGNGEQRYLVVKWDELLHDNLHDVATRTFARTCPGRGKFPGTVHLALAVAAGGHKGLYDTGETYHVCSLGKFLESGGITVVGGLQSQLCVCQFADGLAVHCEVHGTCAGHNLYAHLLALVEFLCADGLYFGHDDVGAHLFHHLHQGIAVQHAEHTTLVCHLHGGGIVILVASDHILALSLTGNYELLTKFA